MSKEELNREINKFLITTKDNYNNVYKDYLNTEDNYRLQVDLSDLIADATKQYLKVDNILAESILTAGYQGFRSTNKTLKKLNPFLTVSTTADAKLRERLRSRFDRNFSYEDELFRLKAQVRVILDITNQGIIRASDNGWGENKTLAYIKHRIIDKTKLHEWAGVLNYQINRAARTETLRAWSIGEDTAFFNSNAREVGIVKYWMAYHDKRTRRDHRNWDGQVADADGYFNLVSYTGERFRTTAPRLGMIAREVINCRCTLGYKLLEE